MKKETFGLILGMILLFGSYIAVQNYYLNQQIKNPSLQKPSSVAPAPRSASIETEDELPEKVAVKQAQTSKILPLIVAHAGDAKLENDYATLNFTPLGGCLGNNFLANEKTAYNNPSPISVVENDKICKAFGFRVGNEDLRESPARIEKTPDGQIQITQRTDNLEIIRTIGFEQKNEFGSLSFTVRNLSQHVVNTNIDLEMGASSDSKSAGGLFAMAPAQFHGAGFMLADGSIKREYTPFESEPKNKPILNETGIMPTWLTVDSLYWMNTLIPKTAEPIHFVVQSTGYNLRKNATAPIDQTVYEAWVQHPVVLNPGKAKTFSYSLYFGPKNETILKKYGQYHLEETIDYGFFKIIARPLYYALDFIEGLVKNWGVAIILLTLFINLIFLPLQVKAYISGQKMQLIQPQIKELQAKYKEDKPTLQKETMALMAKNKVNPLSGCLPLLPQIPVFFGLDSALRHTFDLRQSPFFFWIHDLTQHDPYFILPIIMALLMIAYQKMVPMPSMDPTQAKMMRILPIVFSVFMIFYPSGLALYVITNTLVSMIRQSFLTKKYHKKTAHGVLA